MKHFLNDLENKGFITVKYSLMHLCDFIVVYSEFFRKFAQYEAIRNFAQSVQSNLLIGLVMVFF